MRRSPNQNQPQNNTQVMSQEQARQGFEYLWKGAMVISPQDMRAWELMRNVPELQAIWAYVCLALNIIFPGSGTMLCACLGDININKTQLAIGFF